MLARRLQRHSTPLAARMENPVRARLDLQSAPGSGAALCRWLRASSRRYHRPTGQPKRHERTRNWIKLGGKVNGTQRKFTGKSLPLTLSVPQFFFHVTTAYD